MLNLNGKEKKLVRYIYTNKAERKHLKFLTKSLPLTVSTPEKLTTTRAEGEPNHHIRDNWWVRMTAEPDILKSVIQDLKNNLTLTFSH